MSLFDGLYEKERELLSEGNPTIHMTIVQRWWTLNTYLVMMTTEGAKDILGQEYVRIGVRFTLKSALKLATRFVRGAMKRTGERA